MHSGVPCAYGIALSNVGQFVRARAVAEPVVVLTTALTSSLATDSTYKASYSRRVLATINILAPWHKARNFVSALWS